MRKRLLAAAGALALLLTLLVSGPVAAQEEPGLEDPIPGPIPEGVRIRVETVADGMTAPLKGVVAPGDDRLFVVDQVGTLWAVDTETGDKTVFGDFSDLLVELGAFGPETFDERGFLGVAFHPDYQENGLLYTYTSEPPTEPADFSTTDEPDHQNVVREWQVPDPSDPASVVDPNSSRVLFRMNHPQFNHNAGDMTFGPDGLLYIAVGDGGAADDQGEGHTPPGNGQDRSNPLGDMLRIDPLGTNSANGNYGIPADNPFVGEEGVVEEIFFYGLRNPYRFSFDSATGTMYHADVGQNDIEEVNVGAVPGGNYGWRLKEGSFFFDPNGADEGFVTDDPPPGLPEGLIDPVAEYDHDEGIAVIGGFVYRGVASPGLRTRYVFGENRERLFYLTPAHVIREFRIAGEPEGYPLRVLGFGEDAAGEIYVTANATNIPFGDTGVVQRISLAADREPCTIVGTPDDDVIEGTDGNDVICADEGDDQVMAGRGNDVVYGGPGDDELEGGDGNDRLKGDGGRDALEGGSGNDRLQGGLRADQLSGGAGNDRLFGRGGDDALDGGDDGDLCRGGSGFDTATNCEDTRQAASVLRTTLTGENEIGENGEPGAGDLDGSGTATVALGDRADRVCFEIEVQDITLPAVASHIHQAPAGVNGDIVVPLVPPGADGTSSGCVDDVDPALIDDILRRPRGFYVNVHTSDFPAGALRGQLRRT